MQNNRLYLVRSAWLVAMLMLVDSRLISSLPEIKHYVDFPRYVDTARDWCWNYSSSTLCRSRAQTLALPVQPQAPGPRALTSAVTALGPRTRSQTRRAAAIFLHVTSLLKTRDGSMPGSLSRENFVGFESLSAKAELFFACLHSPLPAARGGGAADARLTLQRTPRPEPRSAPPLLAAKSP